MTNENEGLTPLHEAVINGDPEAVEMLLKQGADVNATEASGSLTPLHLAVSCQETDLRIQLTKLLLRHGAETRNNGWTVQPVHAAIAEGHTDCVEMLLPSWGEVDAIVCNGSLLHFACLYGQTATAEWLLARGASLEVKNDQGETPLNLALGEGHKDTAALLRKHGATTDVDQIQAASGRIQNAIDALQANPHVVTSTQILDEIESGLSTIRGLVRETGNSGLRSILNDELLFRVPCMLTMACLDICESDIPERALDPALALAERCISETQSARRTARGHVYMADVRFLQNRFSEVLPEYRKAIELDPDGEYGRKAMVRHAELAAEGLPDGETKTKSGCYIATACYGSYDHPDVHVLRRFRDERLSTSTFGRLFVRSYYAISPSLTRRLSPTSSLGKFIRHAVLEPFVRRWRDNE